MDSPRAVPALLDRLEQLGGVALMVLSHRDDVADHARSTSASTAGGCCTGPTWASPPPGWSSPWTGTSPVALAPDLLFIPTPGHTAGSACLLYRDKFLFSGDHLWWSPRRGMLSASRSYCWHHWPTQLASLERLLAYDFTWVLPGHGRAAPGRDAEAMRGRRRRTAEAGGCRCDSPS